ncbi:MAG: cupin domain-containing protein [Chloroflexota bacterium]|nr:cupin domain-containing protein [Chloroflexota bacterium]
MATSDTMEVGYDEFCGALAAKDLQPLWTQSGRLMPQVPHPKTLPWLWKWQTMVTLAEKALELVPITKGGDRRVLALANPGLGGMPYTSTTLWAAIQYLGPHESAPAHRHTPSAIRFVIEGEGVWTTVNGDACDMKPGDLILTPNWAWHDHTNAGDKRMVWFDGLDLPFVANLESIFFERYDGTNQPIVTRNGSEARFAGRGLRSAIATSSAARSPLLRYPWVDTDRALAAQLKKDGGPIATIRYVNPENDASALPTLGSEMHRLIARKPTPVTRRAGSAVYVVYQGSGASVIDGVRFEWTTGDIFVAPSWSKVEHEATVESNLFAVTDRPILEALGLYREETLDTRQLVTGTFEPK